MRRLVLVAATVAAVAVAVPALGDDHHATTGKPNRELTTQIARARVALAPFATNLSAAQAAGYKLQITPMMPNMGYHFMNPDVTGFDVRRPPILVYVRQGADAQLVAAEWVFPAKPRKPPLPGARYGSFAAACHYADGNFVPQRDEQRCAPAHPDTGAAFTFWHPDLVTLHLWLWYPNPDGVFNSTNAFVAPFNRS
jgi:hypothetical protein